MKSRFLTILGCLCIGLIISFSDKSHSGAAENPERNPAAEFAGGCTSIMVGRQATVDGSVITSQTRGALFLSAAAGAGQKTDSIFFPEETRLRMRSNAANTDWGKAVRRAIIEGAKPWLDMSEDTLWSLMFGPTITRSWMVWSNGHCPSCKNPVPMYSWKVDALKTPWKMGCPRCGALFPKNDFFAFYKSGLDEHHVFDPGRADRRLLFNTEHPQESDPLRSFGVDDGNGYVDGDQRWRFIGTYLVYGQWKQAVLNGIVRLAQAYMMTGEMIYARKAVILLDRVADLYPTFDFKTQAIMYEGPAAAGYVSTWHDACEETRQLALAYDQVYDVIGRAPEIQAFLARKAAEFKLENAKTTAADIRRNIEERILNDAVANRWKIRSNYPRTETALIIIHAVLGWPENRAAALEMIDEMVKTATAVDGVTGEKGLAGYAASTIANLAYVLALFDRMEPRFLEDIISRHPGLRNSYRFHYDTWFRGLYYPQVGDTGSYGKQSTKYAGAHFARGPGPGLTIFNPDIDTSMFTFFGRLYEITGDPAYIQILFHENEERVEGLPFDLLGPEPAEFQRRVTNVMAKAGEEIWSPSFDKRQWHLAMLRSGQGADERAVWLDYDTGGRHGHADGMNIGLFAKGIDLMPELGYPPVQYGGGWESAKARWYKRTASHNTVVVDGKDQRLTPDQILAGKTTMWGVGKTFKTIRVSGPEVAEIKQYERTVALVDVSDSDSYILDIFRVTGGRDHARFMHSQFGEISTAGLTLRNIPDYGFDTLMRAFRGDPEPRPGWVVDWKIKDRYGYRTSGNDLHLRLTDLTIGAEAAVAEGWISTSGYDESGEAWIPRVMVRRRGTDKPLTSTFIGIIEPYENRPFIASVRRLPVGNSGGDPYAESSAAIEITLEDGRQDLVFSLDCENSLGAPSRKKGRISVQKDFRMEADAELGLVRRNKDGRVSRIALGHGAFMKIADLGVSMEHETDFIELAIDKTGAKVTAGLSGGSLAVTLKGKKLTLE